MSRVLCCLVLALVAPPAAAAQTVEVIGEVRVHGNHTTPDEDILAIAGLTPGATLTAAMLRDASERLRKSGRFESVELRKRFRSIDDPADILVIVLVDEVAGISEDDLTPGAMKRLSSRGMWLPILAFEEGYGFSYGARVSFVETFGRRSRVSVPLTWGGERRAAVEADRTFAGGPVTRLGAAAALTRRVHPFFAVGETRREVRAHAERALGSFVRVGVGARLAGVRFGDLDDTYAAPAVDMVVDTRVDPGFPRNAVHLTASGEQLRFDGDRRIGRWSTDLRGYVGLFGPAVLALRAANVRASGTLPPYEQALLGGGSSLRGYEAGYRAGDNLAALSAELRIPVTSPLSVGRFGVKGFVDAGTVYQAGGRLSDQRFDRGAGAGAFVSWAVLRAGLDVAWPLGQPERSGPRWHFGLGVTF